MRRSFWLLCGVLFCLGCEGSTVESDASASMNADAGAEVDAASMVDCSNRPAEAPHTRGEIAGVYDAARNRIVVYGGDIAAPVMCRPMYDLVDELWAFHLDCNSWERLSSEGGPGVRARHGATVDTTRNRMIVFGGRIRFESGGYQNFNDTWAYDLTADRWEQVVTTGEAPPVRSSPVMAYDEARDRLLVFGGNSSTSGLTLTGMGDLWQLDFATGVWSEITVADGPSPRLYHAGTVLNDSFFVFGGTPNYSGPYLNDVWVFDMATDTWRQLHPGGGGSDVPATRFGAEIFVDEEGVRLLLMMGHDLTSLGNRNDVWEFDLIAGAWTMLHPGDELNPDGSPAGFCDFPADFTIPEPGAPERRYSFVDVQDSMQAFIFGGKTDCGNINDVWSFDFDSNDWNALRPATGGEACNRTGRIGCTTLCY